MKTWLEYARMTPEQLARHDTAAYNLACAHGLPDAEDLDYRACLRFCDRTAKKVRSLIGQHRSFYERNREHYRSWARFQMMRLSVALHETGIRYNKAKAPEHVPLDTADIFIHGAILGAGGTCASLPVLFLAIGRRLGFPLKLVRGQGKTAGHFYLRWEDEAERFNIEVTGMEDGLTTPPDWEFERGKFDVPKEAHDAAKSFVSMGPREELACFLGERGHRWLDYGQLGKAADAFAWSLALEPDNRQHEWVLGTTVARWMRRVAQSFPPSFRPTNSKVTSRRYPDSLHVAFEQAITNIERAEDDLRQRRLSQGESYVQSASR